MCGCASVLCATSISSVTLSLRIITCCLPVLPASSLSDYAFALPDGRGNPPPPSVPPACGPPWPSMAEVRDTTDAHIGILHSVEPVERGMIWTEDKGAPQVVVLKGEDHPIDGQKLLLCHAVLTLHPCEHSADVFPLHHPGQNSPQYYVWHITIQNKRARKVRRMQQRDPAKKHF